MKKKNTIKSQETQMHCEKKCTKTTTRNQRVNKTMERRVPTFRLTFEGIDLLSFLFQANRSDNQSEFLNLTHHISMPSLVICIVSTMCVAGRITKCLIVSKGDWRIFGKLIMKVITRITQQVVAYLLFKTN